MYEASIPEFSFRKTGVCNVITKKIFAKYVLNSFFALRCASALPSSSLLSTDQSHPCSVLDSLLFLLLSTCLNWASKKKLPSSCPWLSCSVDYELDSCLEIKILHHTPSTSNSYIHLMGSLHTLAPLECNRIN